MKVHLQYGAEGLDVELPGRNTTVLKPRFSPGLRDEAKAFRAAVARPLRSRPLRDIVKAADSVAVVIPDITRPFPSDRVLPWLFRELAHVPANRFTIVVGTGSHRGNTREELAGMVGGDVVRRFRIVNHDAHDPATMEEAGRTPDGRPVLMNREYVRAARRILLGFVEPHFFAGFSGGYKAVVPGVADIDSILDYHNAARIGHPRSTWGVLDGNPTQEYIRARGPLVRADFCVNVTLNREHRITRFFCGDVLAAHDEACAFARSVAMARCERRFPIVVTTNGGYPLDQSLYQAVKGMSAAAQIVEDGGLIVAASECREGFPAHGNFRKLLFDHPSPEDLLKTIGAPGFSMFDQWEAQALAIVVRKARVALRSTIPDGEVRRAFLEPVGDIGARVAEELRRLRNKGRIAVLPEGPMTIPYVAEGGNSSGRKTRTGQSFQSVPFAVEPRACKRTVRHAGR